MNGPLFITGTYRAGTTWISLLLNNHPDLNVALHYTNWMREDHAHASDAVEYARKRFGVEPEQPELLCYTHTYEQANLVDWFIALKAIFGMDGRVGEKMQLEWSAIPQVLSESSEAQALHTIRDPRSVFASWAGYTHHDWPAALGAAFNCVSSMQAALDYLLDLDDRRYEVIRYEAVARDLEKHLGGLVRWLGLDWPGEDVMLSTQGWQDVPGSRWQDRSSFGRVDEGFDVEAAIHRWREHLSDEELAFVEHVCWQEMRTFGYEPAHDERPMPDDFPRLVRDMEDDPQLGAWWERFRETGEGVEAFPSDPTDESTWAERQGATA